MSLCPESEYRRLLTDAEFWAHVFQTGYEHLYIDFDGPDLDGDVIDEPCRICGSTGACGYDNEGRSMIHTIDKDLE